MCVAGGGNSLAAAAPNQSGCYWGLLPVAVESMSKAAMVTCLLILRRSSSHMSVAAEIVSTTPVQICGDMGDGTHKRQLDGAQSPFQDRSIPWSICQLKFLL